MRSKIRQLSCFRPQLNHVRVRTKRSCEDHDTNEVRAQLKKVTLSRGRRKKSPIICKIDNASPTRTASPASDHPIGVERITDIQLIRPKEYQPVAAFAYLEKAGIFKSTEGKEWAIEITFDGGRKAQTKVLRPDLPLIIHY
jgi:hypothetical protein